MIPVPELYQTIFKDSIIHLMILTRYRILKFISRLSHSLYIKSKVLNKKAKVETRIKSETRNRRSAKRNSKQISDLKSTIENPLCLWALVVSYRPQGRFTGMIISIHRPRSPLRPANVPRVSWTRQRIRIK